MPIRRSSDGRWRYRHVVHYPDGTRERISGSAPTHINTKAAAEQEMHDHIDRCLHPERVPLREECPTFNEWFHGRFWKEWVVGRKNKPSEQREKTVIFECHLKAWFGDMALDEITTSEIAKFRAHLVARGEAKGEHKLGEKRINNILAVLSKALKYAVDCEVLAKAPKIGMFKIERPEIVAWDFEQYPRILVAAKAEGDEWYAAVCLAGEAGLRVGETKALRWREDVDLIAKTITVNQQTCRGKTGTPKGRTRRMVPMTTTLHDALKRLSVIREGFVVRNLDGSAKTDSEARRAIERICRRAGLPVRQWHTLRHTFGTHAALFGVNPWRLQTWLGHKRIDETMLYVHVAEAHAREWPEPVHEAAQTEVDPDRRIVAMLGARGELRGKTVAKTAAPKTKTQASA
jgi:integrase